MQTIMFGGRRGAHRAPSDRHGRRWWVACTAVAIGLLGAPVPAQAEDPFILVNTADQEINNDGLCSLQEAILAANHDAASYPDPNGGAGTIDGACRAGNGADVIELLPDTYSMPAVIDDAANYLGSTATPFITSSMIIEGRGSTIVRAAGAPRMRAFSIGVGGDLDLREVHVKNFSVKGGNGASGGGGGLGAGGAIAVNHGALRVQWSTFSNNSAAGGNGTSVTAILSGGGGGGMGGNGGRSGEHPSGAGGGGGGARGNGADGDSDSAGNGGGGGGTIGDGGGTFTRAGGHACGGKGGQFVFPPNIDEDGEDGCAGGGGGGGRSRDFSPGGSITILCGNGGSGGFGGGGGGGGSEPCGGGDGGFGGGGGAGSSADSALSGIGPDGGDGGFGGGGGAAHGGYIEGGPGQGGTFAGDASTTTGGGGAALGGAIFGYAATITVSNTTLYGNSVARGHTVPDKGSNDGREAGGAVFTVAGSLTIQNSTISGNTTGEIGGGVTVYEPTTGESAFLSLRNTIIAGNSGHDECYIRSGVSQASTGNLIRSHDDDDQTPCVGVVVDADPLLKAPALNPPGRTMTMALDVLSPAIDAGSTTMATPDDQRGVARPQLNGIDIGAYEFDVPADVTAPVADPVTAPAANGYGWNNTDVTVAWNWADEAGGSGVNPAACTASSTSSGEAAGISLSATCSDRAGNQGSAGPVVVNVDKTAPGVTCVPAAYVLGGDHIADVTATVTDGLSQPVATTASGDVTAANLATPGVKTVSVTGADRAGNTTTVGCAYTVGYRFGGFTEPVPQSSYKRGSTIPVKFQLTDAGGTPIPDADAASLLSPTCRVQVTFDGVGQGCAGYDAVRDRFLFTLKTGKGTAAGDHLVGIRVTAPDGSGVVNANTVLVVLKK